MSIHLCIENSWFCATTKLSNCSREHKAQPTSLKYLLSRYLEKFPNLHSAHLFLLSLLFPSFWLTLVWFHIIFWNFWVGISSFILWNLGGRVSLAILNALGLDFYSLCNQDFHLPGISFPISLFFAFLSHFILVVSLIYST